MKSNFGNVVVEDIKTYNASGAINVEETAIAILDGENATVAATLADGQEGQTLIVVCINADETTTLVPSNFLNGTTMTFTESDGATLVFVNGQWSLVGNNGVVIS